ncbi:MAG: LuxR C-terminal-related transcriptional regulator [Xanthobacteraceae bacterium]|nr:LuxR C-terminal-related transcriptional regulator [Xanthobacteraceae bacterium]
MIEDPRLSRLITDIYDTALDPASWSGVLASMAGTMNAQAGALLSKDSSRRSVDATCHTGLDPHFERTYADTYGKLGPVATSAFCDTDRIASIPELMPYDEYCRSSFYREWAKPQGWADVAVGVLEKSASGCAYLSFARNQSAGMVDDDMRRRLSLVLPHVRRAVLVGKALEFKQAEAAAFADMLDGLSAGLFLLDAGGRVVHANAAANEILDAADFLRATCGRLAAGDSQADQTLRDALAATGNGDAAIGARGIALPLIAHDGVRHVAHVLPLTSGTRRAAGMTYTATAALFVRKAALAPPSTPDVISKTYNLTPAELRVLLAIVEIGGVPEVADALGVADTTVKTHLSRLFEKTGTGRQADLVKLVAGFSMPLAS